MLGCRLAAAGATAASIAGAPFRAAIVPDERVRQALGFDGFGGTGSAVDHGRHADHLPAGVLHGAHRSQGRGAGGAGVLYHQDPSSGNVGTLDKTLHAMGFH